MCGKQLIKNLKSQITGAGLRGMGGKIYAASGGTRGVRESGGCLRRCRIWARREQIM